MKKILASVAVVALLSVATIAATRAYFTDTEKSEKNSFTAGSLDLQVDGENPLVSTKFTISNLKPGSQPKGTFHLDNVGSIPGYIDISALVLTEYENDLLEPEVEAGDIDDGLGELGSVLNARMFIDYNCDGWISAGDVTFYNGYVSGLPSSFNLNESLAAGGTKCITFIFDWWNTTSDNLAMTDSFDMDLTFELNQNM